MVSAVNADPAPDNGGFVLDGSQVNAGKANASEQLTANKNVPTKNVFAQCFDTDETFINSSYSREPVSANYLFASTRSARLLTDLSFVNRGFPYGLRSIMFACV